MGTRDLPKMYVQGPRTQLKDCGHTFQANRYAHAKTINYIPCSSLLTHFDIIERIDGTITASIP